MSCISIKNRKTPNQQCNRKRKPGYQYCGLHNRAKVKFSFISNNEKQITLVQAMCRRFLVLNRKRCINEYDLFTCETKYEIPPQYFFKSDDNYFFDIRTLHKSLQSSSANPYTMKQFSKQTIKKYELHRKWLREKQIPIKFQIDSTPEQEYKNKLTSVFNNFEFLLDHSINTDLFDGLTLSSLKSLFFKADDIWSNRIQMAHQQRLRIVPAGTAFNYQSYHIRGFSNTQTDILELKTILLNEFNMFATYSMDVNDRKLGAMLMMIALVEISQQAAEQYPSYAQQYY